MQAAGMHAAVGVHAAAHTKQLHKPDANQNLVWVRRFPSIPGQGAPMILPVKLQGSTRIEPIVLVRTERLEHAGTGDLTFPSLMLSPAHLIRQLELMTYSWAEVVAGA